MRKWLIEQKVDEKGGLEEDEEGEAFKEGRSFKQVSKYLPLFDNRPYLHCANKNVR